MIQPRIRTNPPRTQIGRPAPPKSHCPEPPKLGRPAPPKSAAPPPKRRLTLFDQDMDSQGIDTTMARLKI